MNTDYRQFCAALIAALFATSFSGVGHAEENASVPVVVVDLNKVFEQHPTFKQQIDQIKASVQASEADFMNRGKQMEARVKQLQALKSNTDQYKQLESEIARSQAKTQTDMALKRKDFLEQEARVYYDVYQQVKQEIKVFAESNRIGLVLRYSSEKIDPSNRQSVMQGVNQPIVYNQGGLDITQYIVERLHRRVGGQRTANASPSSRATQGRQQR